MAHFSFEFPYYPELSDNNRIKFFRGHYFKNSAARKLEDQMLLVATTKKTISKAEFIAKVPVKVDLCVHKPTHRGDASNFLKVTLDVVKKVIGIDDCWFKGSFDWAIDKNNPRFVVTVTQDGKI